MTKPAYAARQQPQRPDPLVELIQIIWIFRVQIISMLPFIAGFIALLVLGLNPARAGVIAALALVGTWLLAWPILSKALLHSSLRWSWDAAQSRAGVRTKILSRTPTKLGERLEVRTFDPIPKLEQAEQALANALHAHEVRVSQHAHGAHLAVIEIVRSDPFAGGSLLWPNRDAEQLSILEPIPWGQGELGDPVTVTFGVHHASMLAAGMTGAGKSTAQNQVLATAALDPGCDSWGIDGKRGVELRPWKGSMIALAGEIGFAIDVLKQLTKIMDERWQRFEIEQVTDFTMLSDVRPQMLFIDELALFTVDAAKDKRDEFIKLLSGLLARGRAAAIFVFAATQRTTVDVVPGTMRMNFDYRWCGRVRDRESAVAILGSEVVSAGFEPMTISKQAKGRGILDADGDDPVREQGYLLTKPDVQQIAQRAADLRAKSKS